MKKQEKAALADTLRVALRRLEQQKVRCVDVETSGLDWRVNAIVGYVLSFGPDPRDSYYLPFRHAGDQNIEGRAGLTTATGWDGSVYPEERDIIRLLDRQGDLNFGHNLAFDLKFLHRVGLTDWNARYEDTIINAPLLDEWQAKFSLEHCAEAAGVAAKKSKEIVDYLCSKFPEAAKKPAAAMGHFWRLSGTDPMANDYARGDGTTTWQLRDWQMGKLATENLGTVHDIESRLIPVLARMTTHGIRIDEDRLNFLLVDVDEQVEALLAKMPKEFNPRSPKDVHDWCMLHGRTDWPMTPGRISNKETGERTPQPSFPEAWLETFPEGKQIVDIRKLTTLRDTFLTPMRDTHLWNGRVHTEYNQLRGDQYGTVTGRLSSSNPNLQAVSKHDEAVGRLHRSIFIPDPGKIWGNADYSQIEPRLLAYYSRAKVLMEGYLADPPVDAHTSVSAAANKNWPNMTKAEQKQYRNNFGKRINQTVITGGGKGVLVEKYKIPMAEVEEMLRNYHRAMPELKPLQNRAKSKMERVGFVMSLLGRRARLHDPRKSYTAVNRLLQCGNGDAIKLKMVQIDEFLKSIGRPVQVLNSIHDDLAFQFDPKDRSVYNECIKVMTDFGPGQPIELDVPITVDLGEGKSWSEATYDKI